MRKKNPGRRLLRLKEVPNDLTPQLVQRIQALSPSVMADYLKAQFLSKYISDDTDPADVRRTRAITKWLSIESENEATNDRLILTHEEYNILPRVTYRSFVEFCQSLIADIIGESPPLEALIGSFSGGSSTSRQRTQSHPASKYLGQAHVTPRAIDIWSLVKDEMPLWTGDSELQITEVPGNVLFTVPKKTDIDRCACKEPDINMFLQKGIGKSIRRSLRSHGINLNDQTINNGLARIGSVDGSLATIDLSSASDSVSYEIVAQFLPPTWFTLLDSVRSPVTIIDGEEHRNHMFSSMGNGFTFELESLLFYSIVRAVCFFTGTRGKVSVYGDDIICPSGISAELTTALQYFGFSVNTDKSCTDGPFRESCGGHYHNGRDITPFYIKEPIKSIPDLIHVANQLRAWAIKQPIVEFFDLKVLDPEIEEIWLWLKSHIPDFLWGGEDTSYKYQLVSPDAPTHRLVEETTRTSTLRGGYFHWLNATWDRTGLSYSQSLFAADFLKINIVDLPGSVETSELTKSRKSFRIRPVRDTTVPRLKSLFLSEL